MARAPHAHIAVSTAAMREARAREPAEPVWSGDEEGAHVLKQQLRASIEELVHTQRVVCGGGGRRGEGVFTCVSEWHGRDER